MNPLTLAMYAIVATISAFCIWVVICLVCMAYVVVGGFMFG